MKEDLVVSRVVSDKVLEAMRKATEKHRAEALSDCHIPLEVTTYREKVDAPAVASAGQRLLSELLPIKLGTDFAVTCLQLEDIPEQVRVMIPRIDPLYCPDIGALSLLLRAWEADDKTLVTGPTGCGKSQLIRHACALTGRPMIRINMTEDAESSVIFGTLVARSGSTIWEDGPATEAVRYGAVLAVDEWDVTPAGVFMGFQWLLENNGCLFLKEMPGSSSSKVVVPHQNTRFVMCGNTVGQGDDTGGFAGVQPQNSAGIDRFQTSIRMDYLEQKEEIHMLKHALPIPLGSLAIGERTELICNMRKLAEMIREAYSQRSVPLTISSRTLVNWGNKVPVFGVHEAFKVAYLNKLTDTQRKIVEVMYRKVFVS